MATRSATINVMIRAADRAARGLKRDFGEVANLQVSRKGPADFVSAADLRAEQVLRERPDAVSIFIMPPSFEDLGKRLRGRNLDESDEIRRRLAVSVSEIRRYDLYQYVIINDDLERASRVLAAIILEKRHCLDRMKEAIGSVIDRFPAINGDDAGRVEMSVEE